ncbi:DUF2202 domain-containing protein [Kosmotoga pacifica]|uniref:DUF2202 domain-containing protein n=1 Tax=Kosmotoga pacifica TaxID=1330330 RepID=A0A0G2Z751_9BACT|nr:DUF2202 domain-containing protein [Kosmotoga pacifica]AKI97430.1 hypothetical protein IX53_05925 [Kosmotoga pacifica]
MKKLVVISIVLLSVMSIFAVSLSDEELNGILQMREEEKLARDVYLELYDIWGLKTFYNIAQSEQTHMDRVGYLIDLYNLQDPALEERGEFTNEDLQALYEKLITQGSASLIDAIKVGMLIEELDIKDLLELMETTNNEDLLTVYEALENGSENHLRAFNRQLEKFSATYEYQYISEELAKEILSGK